MRPTRKSQVVAFNGVVSANGHTGMRNESETTKLKPSNLELIKTTSNGKV